jgi:hypothetical protein
MALTDINGRPYAHVQTVLPGDVIETDGDFNFTCLPAGARKQVRIDEKMRAGDKRSRDFERLYVQCGCPSGRHYLWQQLGDDGELVGFYRCGEERAPVRGAVPKHGLGLHDRRIVGKVWWPWDSDRAEI